MKHLPDLAALGITAIELMPIADFPGPRNWGYDGVLIYAPDASYGTPDELKALVDTAHGLGIMVFLDVAISSMRATLEAGAHFGHQTHCWNPKMNATGSRSNIHIIDPSQSLPCCIRPWSRSHGSAAGGGRVLFVGTKRQASEPVAAVLLRPVL